MSAGACQNSPAKTHAMTADDFESLGAQVCVPLQVLSCGVADARPADEMAQTRVTFALLTLKQAVSQTRNEQMRRCYLVLQLADAPAGSGVQAGR